APPPTRPPEPPPPEPPPPELFGYSRRYRARVGANTRTVGLQHGPTADQRAPHRSRPVETLHYDYQRHQRPPPPELFGYSRPYRADVGANTRTVRFGNTGRPTIGALHTGRPARRGPCAPLNHQHSPSSAELFGKLRPYRASMGANTRTVRFRAARVPRGAGSARRGFPRARVPTGAGSRGRGFPRAPASAGASERGRRRAQVPVSAGPVSAGARRCGGGCLAGFGGRGGCGGGGVGQGR
ncbi:MAG: hypothetical protein QOJ50_1756, partial [Cryptosporangiaceae bacterium]|nr:hypothetical protein [Cryptosporangiaceae bacterium]